MQAGGAAAMLAYIRSGSAIERLFIEEAADRVNRAAERNEERRDRNLAVMLANVIATGSVDG